jgi:hypothetical protein
MSQKEIIHFSFQGLELQEPMSAATNWLIASFCFYAFLKLKNRNSEEVNYWKYFFIIFSFSTFFAGFGHLFFRYFAIPGKFPNWITGVVSGYFAGNAMLVKMENQEAKNFLKIGLIVKASVFLFLALWKQNFLFIAIDAIATYLFFCGVYGYIYFKKGHDYMKYMVLGVLVCLPSAFIFLFKINIHKWLNKDDLSHLFMLGCTICFYLGAKNIELEEKVILS